jgi:hypothetical protein
MKALLSLLTVAIPSYAGSIKEDMEQYDVLVNSAVVHYTNGKNAFDNRPSAKNAPALFSVSFDDDRYIISAAIETGMGKQAALTAESAAKLLREYLAAHLAEPDSSRLLEHLTDYSQTLKEVSVGLSALEKSLVATGEKPAGDIKYGFPSIGSGESHSDAYKKQMEELEKLLGKNSQSESIQ